MNPLVSILIPTYNRKNMVCNAIDSALRQTYDDVEIIVTDNGSNDGSYEFICERYRKHSNVRMFENGSNLGLTKNWIKCLEKANGDYIKILFSDDLIDDDFVERCVLALENNKDCAFVHTDMQYIDLDGKPIDYIKTNYVKGTGKKEKKEYYDRLFGVEKKGQYTPATPGCALFRRKDVVILDHIDNKMGVRFEDSGAGIDIYIYLNSLKNYSHYYYIDEKLASVRFHNESESVKNRKVQPAWEYAKYIWLAEDESLRKLYSEVYFFKCMETYNSRIDVLNKVLYWCERIETLRADKVASWMDERGIKNVAIYGAGYAGRALDRFFKDNTDFDVKYLVDRNKSIISYEGVVGIDEDWLNVDAIIVTTAIETCQIKRLIEYKLLDAEIIEIENFLNDVE